MLQPLSQEEVKGSTGGAKKGNMVKKEGQDKMSLEDLKAELEKASERNEKPLMISLLNSINSKAFGP